MDGVTHLHAGKAGSWVISIIRTRPPEGGYSAAAELGFKGRHMCKLVLSSPDFSIELGDEMLTRKCVEWIERYESAGAGLTSAVEPEEA